LIRALTGLMPPLASGSQAENYTVCLMTGPTRTAPASSRDASPASLLGRWRRYWRRLSPIRQDRFITLGPLLAVALFLAAVIAAFAYLRLEEIDREREAVRRDLEYGQQRLRLRLLERQEQLMRLGRDISNDEVGSEDFVAQAESMVNQHPELLAITWLDARRRVKAGFASPSATSAQWRNRGETLSSPETEQTFGLTRDLRQPVYSRPLGAGNDSAAGTPVLQLQIPLELQGKFGGVIRAHRGQRQIRRGLAGRPGPGAGRQPAAAPPGRQPAAALVR